MPADPLSHAWQFILKAAAQEFLLIWMCSERNLCHTVGECRDGYQGENKNTDVVFTLWYVAWFCWHFNTTEVLLLEPAQAIFLRLCCII